MPMSARETAEFLLQVGRFVQAVGYSGGLSPAQWMALRYFSRANSFSRTPSAFAAFQATTRGTASIAIKELKAGGYLTEERSKVDGRSTRLMLTAKGKKALARDPFDVLVRAVEVLDKQTKTTIRDGLDQVLTFIAAGAARQRFGVCENCTHLCEENSSNPVNACALALVCRRHRAPIPPGELNMLCAYFQPTKQGQAARSPRRRQKRSAGF
jgi:DNA-binding MarR family transcriptional regulator